MTVMGFGSFEEMQDFLHKQAETANNSLHQAQRAITYGNHWVQFAFTDHIEVEFGRVHTLDEIRAGEKAAGASDREVEDSIALTEAQMMDNLLYGTAYIVWQPEGELGYAHKAAVWPIEERLFNAAKAVDWEIDRLDDTGKVLLEIAFAAWRTHERSVQHG